MRGKPQITRIPQMIAGKGLTVGRGDNLYGTKACVAENCDPLRICEIGVICGFKFGV